MIKRIRAHFREFFGGLIILLVSAAASYRVITGLYPSVFSAAKGLNLATEQRQSYNIFNRDSACVGGFRSRLYREDENTEFNLAGNLFLRVQNETVNSALNFQAVFNPLNQLVAAVLTLKGKDFSLVIGALNVNPVEVTCRAIVKSNQIFSRKFQLPGPLTLSETAGKFFIEYVPTAQQFPLAFNQSVMALLGIRLEPPAGEDRDSCENTVSGTLDPVAESSGLQSRLLKLLPADISAALDHKLKSVN